MISQYVAFVFFSPSTCQLPSKAFGVSAWQRLYLNLNNFPMCGLKTFGSLCWLVEGPFREAKILVCTSLGFGGSLLGNSSLLTDWREKLSSQQGEACQTAKASGREQILLWNASSQKLAQGDTAPASGWDGMWVPELPTVWSRGLEERAQRYVLVPEEGMARGAGSELLLASLCSLGSDNVSRMDAHQLNSNQALIQDLEVKGRCQVIIGYTQDILDSQSLSLSWVPAVYLLRPKFLGIV